MIIITGSMISGVWNLSEEASVELAGEGREMPTGVFWEDALDCSEPGAPCPLPALNHSLPFPGMLSCFSQVIVEKYR